MAKTSRTNKKTNSVTHDISKTGDVKTNDFNLDKDKAPALSTLNTQIKTVQGIIDNDIATSVRPEFDRLRMGINLGIWGDRINFVDYAMEDVENPKEPPSYLDKHENNTPLRRSFVSNDISENFKFDTSDLFDTEEEYQEYIQAQKEKKENSPKPEPEPDIFRDFSVKRRIRYNDYKGVVGLNNMFLYQGYFVIDITGKWMADIGVLGSLHKDNIKAALQKVVDLDIVNFNIDKFIRHAQVFLCDLVVDITLESKEQVCKYIDGISSFFPISTNRHNIAKYGRHGLMLKSKAQKAGFSLAIYSKGQELNFSKRRITKATLYTETIGHEGIQLAERTLRFELKLYSLSSIRKNLNIDKDEPRVLYLSSVLNSTEAALFKQVEKFCGNLEVLSERLKWMKAIETSHNNMTLQEIFVAERFIEILKDNNFDISIVQSHIRTEYVNATDTELEEFNCLANLRKNILTFLVYCKPKSVTIMLDTLRKLQAYYQIVTEKEGANG